LEKTIETASYDVVVIGAGLAGASTAYALAKRGATVCVLDGAPSFAAKASGNRLALVTPYLTAKRSDAETLYGTGYGFTSGLLETLDPQAKIFKRCGVLQFAATNRVSLLLKSGEELLGADRIQRLSAEQVESLSGVSLGKEALYVPDAGYLAPREFVELLLTIFGARVDFLSNWRALSVERSDQLWRVQSANGASVMAQAVVVCSAYEANLLEQSKWLPLEPIRGQTVSVSPSPHSARLKTVLSYGGYLTPAVDNLHLLGAHYQHNDMNESVVDSDSEMMVNKCQNWFPILGIKQSELSQARVCFRTSTIDRLPYIGALPDFDSMRQEAVSYRSGTDLQRAVPNRMLPGLFVNVGHGSRGVISCPLGGEIIARLISDEELGNLGHVAQITNPTRLPHRLLGRFTAA
jgi:tRNA 5-methylaminomethyl-2-thiouridine biosynthesis bifunctional protein